MNNFWDDVGLLSCESTWKKWNGTKFNVNNKYRVRMTKCGYVNVETVTCGALFFGLSIQQHVYGCISSSKPNQCHLRLKGQVSKLYSNQTYDVLCIEEMGSCESHILDDHKSSINAMLGGNSLKTLMDMVLEMMCSPPNPFDKNSKELQIIRNLLEELIIAEAKGQPANNFFDSSFKNFKIFKELEFSPEKIISMTLLSLARLEVDVGLLDKKALYTFLREIGQVFGNDSPTVLRACIGAIHSMTITLIEDDQYQKKKKDENENKNKNEDEDEDEDENENENEDKEDKEYGNEGIVHGTGIEKEYEYDRIGIELENEDYGVDVDEIGGNDPTLPKIGGEDEEEDENKNSNKNKNNNKNQNRGNKKQNNNKNKNQKHNKKDEDEKIYNRKKCSDVYKISVVICLLCSTAPLNDNLVKIVTTDTDGKFYQKEGFSGINIIANFSNKISKNEISLIKQGDKVMGRYVQAWYTFIKHSHGFLEPKYWNSLKFCMKFWMNFRCGSETSNNLHRLYKKDLHKKRRVDLNLIQHFSFTECNLARFKLISKWKIRHLIYLGLVMNKCINKEVEQIREIKKINKFRKKNMREMMNKKVEK